MTEIYMAMFILFCVIVGHMGIYEGLQMKVTPAGVITIKMELLVLSFLVRMVKSYIYKGLLWRINELCTTKGLIWPFLFCFFVIVVLPVLQTTRSIVIKVLFHAIRGIKEGKNE